jgi:7-keto-8-aminopelargonate synthetase-like enzyme
MDGDLADLKELVRLKENYGAVLIIDEAHATGVLDLSGLEEKIDVITGTFSKALGALGGFAAASKIITEYLINTSRSFIFATALPPSVCAAALEALNVLREEPIFRERLWKNIRQLHSELRKAVAETGPEASPIFPYIVGPEKEALRLSEYLLENGILVPAVRTPAVPKGKARLRITLSSAHTDEQISKLASLLKKV